MSGARPSVVLVTGGTGFLGSHVARRLAARGDEVHVLARSGSDRSALAGVAVAWHLGDVSDAGSVQAVAASVARRARELARRATCVHSAALISYRTGDGAAQRSANVEGTRCVLAAARAQGFARVLHVSSVVAVGHALGSEALDEDAPWNNAPLGVDYALTKRAAEELALEAAREQDVVVVNPGAIFGRALRASNTARFIRQVAAGRGPPLAPPGAIAVLGIDDAAEGCVLALDRGRRGERYLLVESWLPTLELFRRIARLTGGRAPLCAVPRALWPLVVGAARVLDRVRPIETTPPQALAMLGVALRFDARKARAELGWRPRPFDEVLRETVESIVGRTGNGDLTASHGRDP